MTPNIVCINSKVDIVEVKIRHGPEYASYKQLVNSENWSYFLSVTKYTINIMNIKKVDGTQTPSGCFKCPLECITQTPNNVENAKNRKTVDKRNLTGRQQAAAVKSGR